MFLLRNPLTPVGQVSSFTTFLDHTQRPSQSVGLLWTSDQLVAEVGVIRLSSVWVLRSSSILSPLFAWVHLSLTRLVPAPLLPCSSVDHFLGMFRGRRWICRQTCLLCHLSLYPLPLIPQYYVVLRKTPGRLLCIVSDCLSMYSPSLRFCCPHWLVVREFHNRSSGLH